MVILIVDDDKYNRELLSRMVRHLGWLSDEAGGGREAIEACKNARYDVVLLDLNMPDMFGEEVAKELRAIPDPASLDGAAATLPPMKIVVVSGADTSSLRHPELFDEVLPKPFVLNDLKRILTK
ncbi:MAG: response regulator, partial [Spirochaetes bacterium]|nr:response regulator [Spirochaetota bacterium]MBU0954713.1 response regulator [Spirochaetota bacterium]